MCTRINLNQATERSRVVFAGRGIDLNALRKFAWFREMENEQKQKTKVR